MTTASTSIRTPVPPSVSSCLSPPSRKRLSLLRLSRPHSIHALAHAHPHPYPLREHQCSDNENSTRRPTSVFASSVRDRRPMTIHSQTGSIRGDSLVMNTRTRPGSLINVFRRQSTPPPSPEVPFPRPASRALRPTTPTRSKPHRSDHPRYARRNRQSISIKVRSLFVALMRREQDICEADEMENDSRITFGAPLRPHRSPGAASFLASSPSKLKLTPRRSSSPSRVSSRVASGDSTRFFERARTRRARHSDMSTDEDTKPRLRLLISRRSKIIPSIIVDKSVHQPKRRSRRRDDEYPLESRFSDNSDSDVDIDDESVCGDMRVFERSISPSKRSWNSMPDLVRDQLRAIGRVTGRGRSAEL